MDELLVWMGIKCSSWIGVNVGTSGRSPCNPYGRYWYKSVCDANTMLERTMFSDLSFFHYGEEHVVLLFLII